MSRNKERHGRSNTTEYRTWSHMIQRCTNPKNDRYAAYGGRGITVYPEWLISFTAFYEHVGPKPSPGYTLDRIDNHGNYEPGNVRWATYSEQNFNQRKQPKWTHCARGHELTPENTIPAQRGGKRGRTCRECKNQRERLARHGRAVPKWRHGGHGKKRVADGVWMCHCGTYLGKSQHAAEDGMRKHRAELWAAQEHIIVLPPSEVDGKGER